MTMKIRLKDETGKPHVWDVARRSGAWELTDHDGYVRVLEPTWLQSVPRIKLCADNHGLTLDRAID
jgi:hypothetical protein